jgi:hypothetical protein
LKPDLQTETNPQTPFPREYGVVAFNVATFVDFLEGNYLEGKDVFVFFDSPVCFMCGDLYPTF